MTFVFSSQNCHELEKMDLEECILVRQFVVSLFSPHIMLVVFIYVESGIILGLDQFVCVEIRL